DGTRMSRRSGGLRKLFLPSSCTSPILQQLPRLDRERLCDPGDIIDRHVALGALDRTKIGAVDAAFVRERFLGQAARSAQLAHVPRQNVPQRSLVCPFHGHNQCQLTLLRRTLLRYNQTNDVRRTGAASMIFRWLKRRREQSARV